MSSSYKQLQTAAQRQWGQRGVRV